MCFYNLTWEITNRKYFIEKCFLMQLFTTYVAHQNQDQGLTLDNHLRIQSYEPVSQNFKNVKTNIV